MRKGIAKILATAMIASTMVTAVGCSSNNEEPNNTPNNNVNNENNENNGDTENNEQGEESGDYQFAGEIVKDPHTGTDIVLATNPGAVPANAAARTETLIYGGLNPDGLFNPVLYSSTYDGIIVDLVFGEGLVTGDGAGNAIPGALTDTYEISEDGLTYTFYMKEGLQYSNGNEITAHGISLSYHIIGDPSYDGTRGGYVTNLVGIDEYREGDAERIEGIEIIDDYTIAFHLQDVSAKALWDFTWAPLDPEVYVYEKGDISPIKDLFQTPVGAGPYVMTNYTPGEAVEFEANPLYYHGEAKIPNLIYKATTAETAVQELVTGGVDITGININPQDISMVEDAGFLNIEKWPRNGFGYIGWDLENPVFAEKEVRQALTIGTDRAGFMDAFFEGMAGVQQTFYPTVSPAYTDDINTYDYNPELANQMLDDAGWERGADGIREKDGVRMEVRWMSSSGSEFSDMLVAVVLENWTAMGVDLTVEFVEFATLADKVRNDRDVDMWNMAWNLSTDPDPAGIFGQAQNVPGGNNYTKWDNEESEELIQAGLRELDHEKRMEIYQEWAKLVNEELPYMFLNAQQFGISYSSRVANNGDSLVGTYKSWVKDVHLYEIVE